MGTKQQIGPIRSDLPVPAGKQGLNRGILAGAIAKLSPGQSRSIVEDGTSTEALSKRAWSCAKRLGMRIVTRKEDGGIRIWRVA